MLLCLICLLIIVRIANANPTNLDVTLFTDISPLNTSHSLQKIKDLPIVYYKFLYDSVPDRIQLGVIGPEAQKLFPESIDVLPSTAFATFNKSENQTSKQNDPKKFNVVTVTNFPIVDKNVIFMHGLAALKELIQIADFLEKDLESLKTKNKGFHDEYHAIRSQLMEDVSKQSLEKLSLIELENKVKKQELINQHLKDQIEDRKLQIQLKEEKALQEFEESLIKERLFKQENITKENILYQLQLEQELFAKKEKLHQETIANITSYKSEKNHELELKKLEYEKEKIKNEIESKLQQEKLNEEISLRKLQTQSKLDTERMVQGIKSITIHISSLIKDLISRPTQILIVIAIILGFVFLFYLLKEFSAFIRHFIQSRIGKPSLVRETSYQSFTFSSIFFPFAFFNSTNSSQQFESLEKEFEEIILSSEDKKRVVNLALSTQNTKSSNAPYRHILLHGPPGTGKTLIARKIAHCSNMDYAILSGGDIAPLGEDAVTQLHSLFKWARTSTRGLLIFIDEAEAFLSSRNLSDKGAESVSSDAHVRNALNALLYQTGNPSKHFMMILATNRPEDLDEAILDRIDVTIQVSLPALLERQKLIQLYLNSNVLQIITKKQKLTQSFLTQLARWILRINVQVPSIDEDCVQSENLIEIAEKIEGFSGREISKLLISTQYAMFLAPDMHLTLEIWWDLINQKVKEHYSKIVGFQSAQLLSSDFKIKQYSKLTSCNIDKGTKNLKVSKKL